MHRQRYIATHSKTIQELSNYLKYQNCVQEQNTSTSNTTIFHAHIQKGTITVKYVDTENQIADIFTKPLHAPLFLKHRLTIMGW